MLSTPKCRVVGSLSETLSVERPLFCLASLSHRGKHVRRVLQRSQEATEVVFDHSGGDTVCSECGLVLESHSIDETYEWRIFANESGDNDPVRVGGPTNPLLTHDGLSTVIAKPNGGSDEFLSSSLGRWQNRGSNPDRALILAFKTIATMSDRLGLVATIKDRANEIYKRVEDQKSSRGRNQDALLAACLYIACR
ncbi:hypothetical protein Fmac_032343 [Flemingia macrophylla]|uniref:TFIIB-type domain-containing protein n=1 Tax=Flemingia macrophylla TaxID=520843 RepID=A0ABD1L4N0_9FABA